MPYKIAFQRGKRVVYEKAWPCELDRAIAHAEAQLPILQAKHGAVSGSVICERTGQVVFSLAEEPAPEPAES